jgi:hypothetical protein
MCPLVPLRARGVQSRGHGVQMGPETEILAGRCTWYYMLKSRWGTAFDTGPR